MLSVSHLKLLITYLQNLYLRLFEEELQLVEASSHQLWCLQGVQRMLHLACCTCNSKTGQSDYRSDQVYIMEGGAGTEGVHGGSLLFKRSPRQPGGDRLTSKPSVM